MAAVVVLLLGGTALAEMTGTPRIIDGRTLEAVGERIRLFGIDAPDLDQVCQHGGRNYECGRVARAALWDLVAGLDVSCQPEPGVPEQDGSVIATCTAGGFSLNQNMVYTGWAIADRTATNRYVAAEADARKSRRGLWRGQFQPPSSWREAHSGGAPGTDDGTSAPDTNRP